DSVLLETEIEFWGLKPDAIHEGEVTFQLTLPVRQPVTFEICVRTKMDGRSLAHAGEAGDFQQARMEADVQYWDWRRNASSITTEHELFNLALERGLRDVYILRQPTPKGWGLAAGIPWYCAVFGRDSAITALQLLPFAPQLAKETIEVLAAYQGRTKDQFKAEHPGRILHEIRFGELSRTKTIPHSPYFGTVDATQLWLILLGRYVQWTGDLELPKRLWPNVRAALGWLDRTTDGGYITYKRESPHGLENQGWKDSGDSVMHVDGNLAPPPIALC